MLRPIHKSNNVFFYSNLKNLCGQPAFIKAKMRVSMVGLSLIPAFVLGVFVFQDVKVTLVLSGVFAALSLFIVEGILLIFKTCAENKDYIFHCSLVR